MNLSDFEITTHSGLYVSKEPHEKYGKKYITRFQHDKKRYVKVLGYSIRDKMSVKNAFDLMQKFKDTIIVEPHETIIEKPEEKIVIQEKKVPTKDNTELIKLKEENDFFKSILGDYKKLKPEVLAEGIQKIHVQQRDLNADPSITGRYDFICCTVVMMFLQAPTVKPLIAQMQQATNVNGLNLIV